MTGVMGVHLYENDECVYCGAREPVEIDMIVYDLEIVKAILGKNESPKAGVEYCEGWHDHKGMGISVLTAYDYDTDRYHVFMEDNLKDFEKLCEGRLVIGFNSIHFDDKVCAAAGITISTVYGPET